MITIDELHIRARGNDEDYGRALTGQLTEKLAEAVPDQERDRYVPEIRVQLQSSAMENTGQLADRIVEQIIQKIQLETF